MIKTTPVLIQGQEWKQSCQQGSRKPLPLSAFCGSASEMPIFPHGPERSHSTRSVFLSDCIKTNTRGREFFPISFKRLPPHGGLLLIQGSGWGFASRALLEPQLSLGKENGRGTALGTVTTNSSVPQRADIAFPFKNLLNISLF